jgi:hypothetical protein
MLKTSFWQNAARSLHPSVRSRHIAAIERAENFDLALGAVMEACSSARETFSRMFQTRRPSHGHR